jgi:aminoglycoside phosphotransferase (APT) family kinase protein
VKEAVDEATAGWLKEELRIYRSVRGTFLPKFLGWIESPPTLILEDLSGAHWPPPWDKLRIDSNFRALREVHESPPPPGLKPLPRGELAGWRAVARDPKPFLSLSLCSADWLEASLPTLVRAEEAAPLDGDRLIHLDVRSDNVCFVGDRAILVDWNWACLGNPDFDIAFWLPSLEAEGGPPPETFLPRAPELAAVVSGFFAAHAGLPDIPTAPRVRSIQKTQLGTALPWACRALGLKTAP